MATIADALKIKLGLDSTQFESGLNKAKGQLTATGQAMEQVGAKWKGVAGSLVRMVAAPVAGFLTMGSVVKSYFGGVAEVARMTGAYSTKMEEWAKKRAMLARYNREDIELYKKGREAVTKFQITMADLSAKIMRSVAPAIKWLIDGLNKFSAWINRNAPNIIRFLSVMAVVITTALIPAFTKWLAVMWKNPLTGLILTLGVIILLIDDFVTWLKGGESALGDFWEMFGSREEQTERINRLLGFFRDHLKDIIKLAGAVFAALAGWKILATIIGGVSKAIHGVKAALVALSAHPIVALLTAVIGLVMWIISAFQRCGGEVGKVWGTMRQDVVDFLNIFGGLGDYLQDLENRFVNFLSSLFPEGSFAFAQQCWDNLIKSLENGYNTIIGWFSDLGKSIKKWFSDKIDETVSAWTNLCNTVEAWYNKIIGWFSDIGKAIKEAFSFDGISDKVSKTMSKLNPMNWFGGGDEDKAQKGTYIPPTQQLDQRSYNNRNSSYSDQSQYNIEQNFNVANAEDATAIADMQRRNAVNDMKRNNSQVNASSMAIWG